MENYYEILQVSSNATKEIIDKAYKTLAKKYHPDANPPEKKGWAEENFKKINEAYETISDKDKREKYDEQLKKAKQKVEQERYNRLYEQNEALKRELNNLRTIQARNVGVNNIQNQNRTVNNNTRTDFYNNLQQDIDRKVAQSINKAYHDAYIQRMKDYGYKIRYKKSLKERLRDLFAMLIAISITAIVLLVLWQIPSFRNHVESNEVYQIFVKIFDK